MTTIAFDGKMLAADSQATADHMIAGSVKKLHLVRDALVAFAGPLPAGMQFVNWLQGMHYSTRPPTCELSINWDDTIIYLLHAKCGAWRYEGSGFPFELPPGSANGSGIFIARTAMHLGRDAYEAVKVASELDIYTGAPVVAGWFKTDGLPEWMFDEGAGHLAGQHSATG